MKLAGEQTHYSTPRASEAIYLEWIKDRFGAVPAPDGCKAIEE